MHLLIALKAFFLVMFNGVLARDVDHVLHRRGESQPRLPDARGDSNVRGDAAEMELSYRSSTFKPPADAKKNTQPAKPTKPARSEALTLLAALQREGRFVDFLKEPLTGYSDAQVGAVARDLHRDCGKVVERMFAVAPLLSDAEGAALEIPAGFDAARYRLTGNVGGAPPLRGALVHPGWQATLCELPTWSGSDTASRVIAPAEVEVRG